MEKPMISIRDLSVYYGQTPALTGVCLDVQKGDYLGIIGPNGGGKSTLLKAILGLAPVHSGDIRIEGKRPGHNNTAIGYVPQFTSLDRRFPITLNEVVLMGRLKRGLSPLFRYTEEDKAFSHQLLTRVGLEKLTGRRISDLSGGEFQRMLIARALAVKPQLLLLDEPTASVDAASRDQIYSLLADLNQDMTIILVTHDLFAVSSHVRRLACLNGQLVYHGAPELTEEIVNSLYGCPVDLIAHGVPHRVLSKHERKDQ
jgi:zinc transport system ATP-binding protein